MAWHDELCLSRCAACGASVEGGGGGGGGGKRAQDEWSAFCSACAEAGALKAHDTSLLGRCLAHLELQADCDDDGGDGAASRGCGGTGELGQHGDGRSTWLRLSLALVVYCLEGEGPSEGPSEGPCEGPRDGPKASGSGGPARRHRLERRLEQVRSLQASSPEESALPDAAEHAAAIVSLLRMGAQDGAKNGFQPAGARSGASFDGSPLREEEPSDDWRDADPALDLRALSEHVLRAVEANAFAVADAHGIKFGRAVFLTASSINHCCSGGNAEWLTTSAATAVASAAASAAASADAASAASIAHSGHRHTSPARIAITALRALAPHEQVSIAYSCSLLYQPTGERRKQIREQFGFRCACVQCQPAAGAADAVRRRDVYFDALACPRCHQLALRGGGERLAVTVDALQSNALPPSCATCAVQGRAAALDVRGMVRARAEALERLKACSSLMLGQKAGEALRLAVDTLHRFALVLHPRSRAAYSLYSVLVVGLCSGTNLRDARTAQAAIRAGRACLAAMVAAFPHLDDAAGDAFSEGADDLAAREADPRWKLELSVGKGGELLPCVANAKALRRLTERLGTLEEIAT